jgi:hypothetical protein
VLGIFFNVHFFELVGLLGLADAVQKRDRLSLLSLCLLLGDLLPHDQNSKLKEAWSDLFAYFFVWARDSNWTGREMGGRPRVQLYISIYINSPAALMYCGFQSPAFRGPHYGVVTVQSFYAGKGCFEIEIERLWVLDDRLLQLRKPIRKVPLAES